MLRTVRTRIKSSFREHQRKRQALDRGFRRNRELDKLCREFERSLREMWIATLDHNQIAVAAHEALQLKLQAMGGEELKHYLKPYFVISQRKDTGEFGRNGPMPQQFVAWYRFRTADNWRD